MSEVIRPELYPAPLDVVRQVCSVVGRFDLQLSTEKPLATDEQEDTRRMIKFLEWQMPLIGQEVSVIGEVLDTKDDGLLIPNKPSLQISRDEEGSTEGIITGVYKGFEVLPVFEDGVGSRTRVLHSVEPGDEKFLTPRGDEVTYRYRQYAAVGESGILPREPINAHSAVDLEDDDAIAEINEIIENYTEETARLLKIGTFIDELMAEPKGNRRHDFQVVSYVNSLNLTEGRRLGANDWIEGSPRTGGDFTWCPMSGRNAFTRVSAGKLAILPGYRRSRTNPMSVNLLDRPELYVRAKTHTGTEIVTPVRSVGEVEIIPTIS